MLIDCWMILVYWTKCIIVKHGHFISEHLLNQISVLLSCMMLLQVQYGFSMETLVALLMILTTLLNDDIHAFALLLVRLLAHMGGIECFENYRLSGK